METNSLLLQGLDDVAGGIRDACTWAKYRHDASFKEEVVVLNRVCVRYNGETRAMVVCGCHVLLVCRLPVVE